MTFKTQAVNFMLAAGVGCALAAIVFFAWALIGKRGDVRRRRLWIALSCGVLFVAACLSVFSSYYLILLPQTLPALRPDFQLPWHWCSNVLSTIGPGGIFVSAGLLISALWRCGINRKRNLLISLICLLLVAVVCATDYALIYHVQVPAYDRYVLIESQDWKTHVGERAPGITVVMLDGSKKRLSDFRGKVVLLNFFATWCGPCNYELPHLQELWSDLKTNSSFSMLVVSREETKATVSKFVSKHGFTFPVALDPGAAAFDEFAKEGIPRTYLIGRDGTILFQTLGFGDANPVYQRELATLRRTIDRELAAGP